MTKDHGARSAVGDCCQVGGGQAAALRQELASSQRALDREIQDLRDGSLRGHLGTWLNAGAASPVPRSVLSSLSLALQAPHVTLERGSDVATFGAGEALREQTAALGRRFGVAGGALYLGHNTTHLLLALGRALSTGDAPRAFAHGHPDHRASYVVADLPGWRERIRIPYSHTGFYERRTTSELPPGTVMLLCVLHPWFGTVQRDVLSALPPDTTVILDLSQALRVMAPAQLAPFLRVADAAVFSLGKTFSPLSAGVAFVRDEALFRALAARNPELTASVSSFSVSALAASLGFMQAAVTERWSTHLQLLTRYLLCRLAELEHITVVGCASFEGNIERLGLVSLRSAGLSAAELGQFLSSHGFNARADGTCMGEDQDLARYESVRISLLPHVTSGDIDRLIEVLGSCA